MYVCTYLLFDFWLFMKLNCLCSNIYARLIYCLLKRNTDAKILIFVLACDKRGMLKLTFFEMDPVFSSSFATTHRRIDWLNCIFVNTDPEHAYVCVLYTYVTIHLTLGITNLYLFVLCKPTYYIHLHRMREIKIFVAFGSELDLNQTQFELNLRFCAWGPLCSNYLSTLQKLGFNFF